MTLPKPDEWVFFHDLSGGWRWEHRRAGNTVEESVRSFDTRDECLGDAERNGFLAGPASALGWDGSTPSRAADHGC